MSGHVFDEENSEGEDDEFAPDNSGKPCSSRLEALFSRESHLQGNDSLLYTAPKQPTPPKEVEQTQARKDANVASNVLHATVVYAFVLKDGKFQPMGRLGLALVVNTAKKEGQLLLYHANKQPVTQAVIVSEMNLTVQTETHVAFVDVRKLHWSLAFDSANKLLTFCQWILTIRASFMENHERNLIKMDVRGGEGTEISQGDLVEIEYLEYMVEDGPIFTEFNGNFNSDQVLRVKIGKGKVPKGWEEGITGMRKSGKRLFVIPPDIGYSGHADNTSFPTNTPLMVLVNVKRIKFANPSDAETSPPPTNHTEIASQSQVPQEDSLEPPGNQNRTEAQPTEESTPPENTEHNENAEEDQDTQSTKDKDEKVDSQQGDVLAKKTAILNRMAKLGHSMLPAAPQPQHADEDGSIHNPHPSLDGSDDTHQQQTSNTHTISGVKPPILGPKPNPMAVVCAELKVPPKATSVTTTPPMRIEHAEVGNIVTTTTDGTTATNSLENFPWRPLEHGHGHQPIPYMFPYPHPGMVQPPYYSPYGMVPHSSTGAINTGAGESAGGLGGPMGQGSAFNPYFPPYYMNSPPNAALAVSDVAATDRRHEELLNGIQASHMRFQEDMMKSLTLNLSQLNHRVLDANGNFERHLENIQSSLKSRKALDPESAEAASTEELKRSFSSVLEKLEAIEAKIADSPIASPDGSEGELTSIHSAVRQMSEKMSSIPDKLESLELKLEEDKDWKERYQKLTGQALKIKGQYEEQIRHLKDRLVHAQSAQCLAQSEEAKIKSIMSDFYRTISREFDPEESYSVDLIKKIVVKCIKECTLKVILPAKESKLDEKEEEDAKPAVSSPTHNVISDPGSEIVPQPEQKDTTDADGLEDQEPHVENPITHPHNETIPIEGMTKHSSEEGTTEHSSEATTGTTVVESSPTERDGILQDVAVAVSSTTETLVLQTEEVPAKANQEERPSVTEEEIEHDDGCYHSTEGVMGAPPMSSVEDNDASFHSLHETSPVDN